ncbi:hypothetical protein N7452_006930 [Penicillium brevicompactum]|uniref:Uncharacterized protein n=1 Tax=Penicillium brevicompactum TaxID=5074 RepID=A0A9W9UE95_PENBR|nr:hypothetical protein N7452_006930 [Penicillium brevicompactum]
MLQDDCAPVDSSSTSNPTPPPSKISTTSFCSYTKTTHANWSAADADNAVPIRTADEQIVDESLMNLLKTLTMRIPSVVYRWSSGRRPFDAVSFGDD